MIDSASAKRPDLASGERPGVDEMLIDAEADTAAPPARLPDGRLLLGFGIVLIAFNLRPVFSSLSAVLPEVTADTGLSPAGASYLTTLPILCLGLFAPLAPKLGQRLGTERTLLGVLLFLAMGTALRGLGAVPALFAGAGLAGACIAIGNVLLPGLVKRDFPDRAAFMTGLFTMALCGGAAAAAGLTLPIERLLGTWPLALASWALPVVLAALLWLPETSGHRAAGGKGRVAYSVRGLWRDRLAWQVTLFMGLQSALAYCVFGWLAPILRERGLDAVTAGVVVSTSVMVQVVTCLMVPPIAVRCRDQRLVNVTLTAASVVALIGFLFAPLSTVWVWAVIQGIGQGGLIAVALTMIVLRSPDSHVAAHLSGMAQGVGYVLAATGPLLVGLLRDWTGSHDASAILFLALGAGTTAAGLGAGRNLLVKVRAVPLD